MLIGVLIGLSPWFTEHRYDQAIIWNAVLVGALVLGLAQLEYVSLQRWEETAADLQWGFRSSHHQFAFGYAEAGPLRTRISFLAQSSVLVAALELWQDWSFAAMRTFPA